MYKKMIFLIPLLLLSGCGDGEDTTRPTVISTSPADGASCVATNSVIKATFSEVMGPSFINRTTFTVRKGGNRIAGTVSYGGTFATFLPFPNLSTFSGYTATLTTGVKDSNGNPLAADHAWGFTTGGSATSTVSLATDIQPIFNTYCTIGCHQSKGTASFLPLTDDVAYANLVKFGDVSSTRTTGGGPLVKPCDSSSSVLYKRISGIGLDPGEQKMPPDISLDQDLRDLIKKWIDEGALDN